MALTNLRREDTVQACVSQLHSSLFKEGTPTQPEREMLSEWLADWLTDQTTDWWIDFASSLQMNLGISH